MKFSQFSNSSISVFIFEEGKEKGKVFHAKKFFPFSFRQTLIHNGGVIPKQLYKTESIDEPDGNVDDFETDGDDVTKTKIKLNEANLYQNIKLRPGQFYEIVIKNDDHRAVLTWDFESVKTEVLFTIYETDVDMNVSNGKTFSLSRLVAQQISMNFSPLPLDDEYTSIFDVASMKEGTTYKKKEQTITSRGKESIQGSIEMEKMTYILQWMIPPTIDQSTRLMYFYEVLSSANYRGSMTSLQSQSAISLHSR